MTRFQVLAVAAALAASAGAAQAAVERVPFQGGAERGSIVIRTAERRLYLPLGDGTALRYPVAVGKMGKQWHGAARIDGKYVEPAWSPPAEVKRDNPRMPNVIPPGPRNPMGARALTLAGGEYAIHGTTRGMRASIGTAASYGCIRMYNEDVIDLFDRVAVGAQVYVTP
ncbi:L,D-transpeptidase [Alsobacter sp. KACC 23698]|uniref:L,D-transpeptidase n=1 Tax=Alsobacter sp. KACC 23698 TaxID=3149229 RepID=A0AAU7JDV5_9HYPH